MRPSDYRPVVDKPLMQRGPLIWGMVFFGAMTVLAVAYSAVWAAAIMGIFFGVSWVGLAPGFWFRDKSAGK